MQNIIVGTRGSTLALVGTDLVVQALRSARPGFTFETKIITTRGDTNLSPIPQTSVGKAWFTAEIEDALASGDISLAVHSLKDVAPDMHERFTLVPVLVREDPRDVLISKSGQTLEGLPAGSIVGTDSSRRRALILLTRPDLVVQSVRGNVQTRLQKLQDGPYDALVLASAGLTRLGITDRITQYFDPTIFVPSANQGIIGAQAMTHNTELVAALGQITDPTTLTCAQLERLFIGTIGGGCKTPVGCYARLDEQNLLLTGMLHNGETNKTIIMHKESSVQQAHETVVALAHEIIIAAAATR